MADQVGTCCNVAPNASPFEVASPTDGNQTVDTSPSLLQLPGDVLRHILNSADLIHCYGQSSCLPPEGLHAVYCSCRMARTALLPWIGRRVINVEGESGFWEPNIFTSGHFASDGSKNHLVQRLLCREFPRGATLRSLRLQLSTGMEEHLEVLLDSPMAADVLASVTDLCLVVDSVAVGRVCNGGAIRL